MCFLDFFIFIKQHLILVIVWCLLLIIIFYSIIINWIRGRYEVSCNTLILLINKKNAVIIDIRNQSDYDSGYIIDSVNIPFKNIKNYNIISLKKFKDRPLIIVGDYIKALFSVRKYLITLGFLEVYVLNGGINNWKNNNFPLLFKK